MLLPQVHVALASTISTALRRLSALPGRRFVNARSGSRFQSCAAASAVRRVQSDKRRTERGRVQLELLLETSAKRQLVLGSFFVESLSSLL